MTAMAILSRLLFAVAGVALVALACTLVALAVADVLWPKSSLQDAVLGAIGFVIIAIAVFDVAKYLIEEEVVREREMRQAGETRQSLTRFVSTILIATLLEAVLSTFKAVREAPSDLVYAVLLTFAGIGLLVALGVFGRLSAIVEHDTGETAPTRAKREQTGPHAKDVQRSPSSSR